MSFKVIALLCAQLFVAQVILADSWPGCGCGCGSTAGSSGNRAFVVQSTSPIVPSGLYVLSENKIEGGLRVAGQLPFLGAVALEGCAPDEGCSSVAYSCGGCEIGITKESGCAGAAGLRGCCGAY